MQVTTCWTEPLPIDRSLELLRGLALRQCRHAGDAGKVLASLFRKRDWPAIIRYEIDQKADWSIPQLVAMRQALGYVTKLEELDIGLDKEAEGFRTFLDGEASCQATNGIFRMLATGRIEFRPDDNRMLYAARRFIARVLGPCPRIENLPLSFGPGATTTIKKSSSNPQNKLADELTCSMDFLASGRIPDLIRSCPHWFENHEAEYRIDEDGWLCGVFDITLSKGRLEFVPKSAKTYRCIEKQPTMNTVVQAGLGKVISSRLRAAGLDLRSNSKNHELAKKGSIDGDVATIDLSNASDTISTGLVKFLLPDDWFSMLSAARCGTTHYKGKDYILQKFSAQGNGFTFPLESLIFWALTLYASTDKKYVTVYGDDIICASKDFGSVVRILELCGFSVNNLKSFHEGPFRESCGKDYYKGFNIRPFYQKHLVSGRTLFTLHNFFVRNSYDEEAKHVRSFIPTPLRLYGPDGYGDGHLVSDDFPRSYVKKYLKRGYCGAFFETYSLIGRHVPNRYPGDYVTPLYVTYTKGYEELWPSFKVSDDVTWTRHLRMGTIYDDSFGVTEAVEVRRLPDGRPLWPLPGDDDGRYEKKLIYTVGV